MERGAVDFSGVLLPPKDGVMGRALADLETKLTAWTTAVADVQAELAAQEARIAGAGPTIGGGGQGGAAEPCATPQAVQGSSLHSGEPPTPFTAAMEYAEPDDPEVAAKIEVLRKAMGTGATVAEDEAVAEETGGPDSVTSGCESSDEDEAILASLEPAMANGIRARRQSPGNQKSVRELISYENESLLNSLEPDIADAIRVRYRLFDGRRSVRELIEEYEQEPRPSQERTTWWSRMREGVSGC